MSLLKSANKEYLNGNLEKAYSKYLEIIAKNCLLEKLLFINIDNIRAKKKAENVKEKAIIFTPNLSINSSGRALTLAQIYSLNHEVQLVGLTYSENHYEIWEPLRNLDLNIVNIKYFDFEKFINEVIEFTIFNYSDNIHISKQRLPSIIFGLTYKLIWGSKIIIDVDDNELGIVKAESSLEIDEFLKKNKIINKNANILEKKYTQISESLIEAFDGITTANKYFAEKYSGCLLRHARDIYKNKFDKNKRILIRENLSIPEEARVIVFLGSPRKYKGIIEIAEAIIKSELKQIIYLIVGTFSDKEKFIKKELLKKEDLQVRFLDNIDFDDISSFLSCGDLAVIFQDENSNVGRYQTPAKLSDALINGLKVITNETEGISDLIKYNLFDISTKENLSEKIIESLSVNLRENYEGENIKEIFSLESNNKKLIKYINHNHSKVIDKKLLSLTLTGILGKKIEKLSQQYENNINQSAFESSISVSNSNANEDKNKNINILKDRAFYENNLSCYEELITNYQDNLKINEIVKMSSKLFDYDFFITSEKLLRIAIKRNNELPKVKELIYKQFYYHTFTNWLMKTTEGFRNWSQFYGLSFEYEIDKTFSIMSEFNKNYNYSIRRNFLIILLIKFDESVYKRDIELKTETLRIILKFLKKTTNKKIYKNIFDTLFNHKYVYSQSKFNKLGNKKNKYILSKYKANIYHNNSEEDQKLLKNIYEINQKVLPYNQWKNLELIFNWFGFYKLAYTINKKAKKLVYSQLKINNQNIDNLKRGIKESFLSGDFKKSKEFIIHLQNIIPKSSFVLKANAFIKLMEGDLNNFRKLWPVKNNSNNYINYLRDKRIAIVGPSSPTERNSKYIDEHDIVIRFNYRNPIEEGICKYIGEKTNASIYNSHTIRFLNKLKDKDINDEINKLDFLILRKFNSEFISNSKANVRIIEECDEIFDLYLNSYAALIFDLILCGVNSLSIFNLDFFTNNSHHYVNYRGIDEHSNNIDNNLLLKPIFANHEIHFQRIFMSKLFSLGILDPTKKIIDLLSLKQKDYINILTIAKTKKTSNINNFLKKKVTNILQKADFHFIKKNFNESLVYYERGAYFDINLFTTKDICNYTRILRNFSLFEEADKILEHFLSKYDSNFELIESYCNIAFYRKNYLETIKRWKRLLLLSNRLQNKSKASLIYSKSCYHIGVSYGNMNLFSKANYYLNIYSEYIDLPIEKQNKFSISKSTNNNKTTKNSNLRILCIFDDDSTMFVALDFMKQFSPFCKVDLALITSKNRSKLSERQLKTIKGDVKFIILENQDLIKNTRPEFFSSYNVIVTSKSIPVNCNFFNKGKERPLILSLYMGIDFFPITGFINRRNSDILCVVQKSHIESYKKVIPKKIMNYQSVLHYNPKFYRKNDLEIPKKKVIKNIYFLAQAIVPLSLKGRLHILNLLIQIAEKYSDKNIIIKLRHLHNENLNHAHMEDYPYELLGKDFNLPPNITFSAESFNEVLSKADYCITCSSTAGIEAALSNIPTSFYLNYPDSSKEPMTKASLENFAESGLLSNSNEILDLKINSLNKKWANDFTSDDSSVLKVIQKILEFQKNY